VTVSVNECTPQLEVSTAFVIYGSLCLRSGVPLKVFHVWHSPAVSTVQQHTCCSSAQWLCLLLQSNSVNTKCFISVATTAQWIQQKYKCVV